MHERKSHTKTKLDLIGPLPPYYEIAYSLWGEGVNFDSDGDSYDPESTSWTELTLILRSDENQRIDIDPIKEKSSLMLKTTSRELKEKVILFLQKQGSIK